jgi:hypothetical protein
MRAEFPKNQPDFGDSRVRATEGYSETELMGAYNVHITLSLLSFVRGFCKLLDFWDLKMVERTRSL